MEKERIQKSLFEIVDKIENSTSSIAELRVPIFAPVQKLSGNSKTAKEFKRNGNKRSLKTSWGEVEYRGSVLLTQVHRDILDCIYTVSSNTVLEKSGNVTIYFTLYSVLQKYREDESNNITKKTAWLKDKIEDIRSGIIKYKKGDDGSWFDFNLISSMRYSAEQSSYCIELDRNYLKFYEKEFSIDYKKELENILRVNSSPIRAIVRLFFTHNDSFSSSLLNVLNEIAFPVESSKSLQLLKRDLKNSSHILSPFGIDYNPNNQMFTYTKNENIDFIEPSHSP